MMGPRLPGLLVRRMIGQTFTSICKSSLTEWITFVLTQRSFVDRDMFTRYLGGGIGHLQQFPPAHNDDEETNTHGGNAAEAETDDFTIPRASEDGEVNNGELDGRAGSDNEGEGEGDEEEDGEEDGEEEGDGNDAYDDDDGEMAREDEDAEGDLDEETGNVY